MLSDELFQRLLQSLAISSVLLPCVVSKAQTSPPLSGDQIIERASPAVVLILAGSGDDKVAAIGSGLIVRPDGIQTVIGLISETVTLPYHVFFDAVPLTHLRFFQQLEMFHRTADVICVHVGIDLEGRLMPRDSEIFAWGQTAFRTSIAARTLLYTVI